MRSLAFLIVAVVLAGQVSAREDYVALLGATVA